MVPPRSLSKVQQRAGQLPRDSGKLLSRWSAGELARAVIQRGIVSSISTSTVKRWRPADRIKPWQYRSYRSWQPTDPRLLEKAIPILDLYERAQGLSRKRHIIVCADEETPTQARKASGDTSAAGPGRAVHMGDRY